MSKELQALENIYNVVFNDITPDKKDFALIEKSLKALEIIKNKSIDVHSFMLGMNINTYETFIKSGIKYGWFRDEPTKEEYELLKEILE